MTTPVVKYIDGTSGDDADTGGTGDPWKTLQKGFDVFDASAPHVFNLTGTFTLTTSIDFDSGAATTGAAPIKLRQWNGQSRPLVDSTVEFFDTDNTIDTISFENIDFEFATTDATDVLLSLDNYCQVHGCTGLNKSGAGDYGNFSRCDVGCHWTGNVIVGFTGTSINCVSSSCVVADNIVVSEGTYGIFTADYGATTNNFVYMQGGRQTILGGIRAGGSRCTAHRNIIVGTSGVGDGIWWSSASANSQMVTENYIEDFQYGLDANNSQHSVIARNIFRNVTTHYTRLDYPSTTYTDHDFQGPSPVNKHDQTINWKAVEHLWDNGIGISKLSRSRFAGIMSRRKLCL